MADRSSIEWTEATWNPVVGCSKVSPGCAHCYAETLTMRHAKNWGVPGLPWTPENANENVILKPERLDQPLRWRRPRMVFVNSMSDLFHELVPWKYVARVFAVMSRADHHVFQVLTKRPDRMQTMLTSSEFWEVVEANHGAPLGAWVTQRLPNVWLGTSIENRRYIDRADHLRETPAAVRFISAEPLLGPLVPDDYDGAWEDGYEGEGLWLNGIDWLIVGGESGPGHRAMNPQWARDLRDATRRYAPDEITQLEGAHTAFFFKQWGGRTSKAGGRELDGRTWDEMPTPPEERPLAMQAGLSDGAGIS